MNVLVKNIFLFLFIYFFCFLGAFSKDLLDIFLDRASNILILKILLSALFISVMIYGFSEWILIRFSHRSFTALCYTSGLVSFELLAKYNSIEGLRELIKKYREFKKFNSRS